MYRSVYLESELAFFFTGQRFALLEEKIALAYILHSFSVESVQEIADLKPLSELVMRPKDGLIIKLHPRAKKE